MFDVICPKPAYDRLVTAGLEKRILKQKHDVEDVLLHNDLYAKKTKTILEQARRHFFSQDRKISEKSETYKDVLEFEKEVEEGDFILHEFDNLLIQHPSFLGLVILGQKLFSPEQYGFSSARSLSQVITSFCIGERWDVISYFKELYSWRNGNYKNELSNGNHGDLWFHQTDVSGQETTEQGLFGKVETFDTMKEASSYKKGICAHYNYWPVFLAASLKYAQALGKSRMPEIINWRQVLEQVGAVGTATAEAEFGGGDHELTLMILREEPIINIDTKEKSEKLPLTITTDALTDKDKITYYPCVLNRKLQYAKEDESGKIDLSFMGRIFEGRKLSPHIIYEESDLPQLLAGTYSLFARDRSIMPKIIDNFLKQD